MLVVVILLTGGTLQPIGAASEQEISVSTGVKKDLGTLTPFWRYHPALGEHLGAPLRTFTTFASDEDITFQYKNRPYEKEAIFGDHVNIVRFLGGWSPTGRNYYGTNLGVEGVAQYDLAYRDEEGNIQYRFGEGVPDDQNYVKIRLDPYIQNGYERPRIVIDNIPYAFPEVPGVSVYGQNAPPRDLQEWQDFIEALCREMVRLYSYDLVNTWSFRVATEGNDHKRFTGSMDQFLAYYEATEQGISKVLPGAGVGAYNGFGEFGEHLSTVASYAKENNLKFDWIAASTYSGGVNKDPDLEAEKLKNTVQMVRQHAANGEELPFEIHEYGWFWSNEFGLPTREQGARGAAGNFHFLMNLLDLGLQQVYHWNTTEDVIIDDNNYTFLSSLFWLFSIFNYAEGAHTYELHTRIPENTDIVNQKYKAVGFFGANSGMDMLMVSSFNMNRTNKVSGDVTVHIPKSIVPKLNDQSNITYTLLSDETDVYAQLKTDFEEAGTLQLKAQKHGVISDPGRMGGSTPEANAVIANNYEAYVEMMKDSLTLKDYSGALIDKGDYFEITVNTTSDSVLVLSFEAVDKTAPEIQFSVSPNEIVRNSAFLQIDISDADSGVASASMNLDETEIPYNEDISLWELPLGEHVLKVTAIDEAGNQSSHSITFQVTTDIHTLLHHVERAVNQGHIAVQMKNSLLNKLNFAHIAYTQGQTQAASHILHSFANQVSAQSGKKIETDIAQRLTRDAEYIRVNLKE
ncbi:GH39 family glycosyl hydrolase [Paenibacillus sp. NRS-1760]|uniref:GH39 family glycosyl hydrolase n=1 Tax=Paenibacillus sp. NRS-1760 TaxID=3233902 RepID=UPI003D2BF672